ncbi:MAG: prepilin peptidase [bacterium]
MTEEVFNIFSQSYFVFVAGFLGLIIGSFLNVVALRLLSGESMARPRSECPKCHTKIAWYDNVPILSYILLKAKCRHCKAKISIQYPLVEGASCLLFILLYLSFGMSLKTLFLMILTAGLIVITVTDLKEQLIYDAVSIPLIPLGLLYSFFDIGGYGSGSIGVPVFGFMPEAFLYSVLGAIVGAALFEVISRLGKIFVGERAFGEGDTVLAAGLGAWFGVKQLFLIVALSLIFQVIVGIPIIVINMYKDKDYKSIAYTSLMLFSLAIPSLSKLLGISNTTIGALLTMLVALFLAGIGAIVIIEGAKKRQSFTFLPFGPALVFGAIIAMFFGKAIIETYSLLLFST